MPRKKAKAKQETRRTFTQEFRQEALQMVLDGHSPRSVAERLGIRTNLLYRWKSQLIQESGPAADALDSRVRELEIELRRVERERDILKKALAIFGRTE
jgi:transposase